VIAVAFSSSFKRAFRKRVRSRPHTEERFWQRLDWFIRDPFDARLRTHKLSGALKEFWAFSVEDDVRVVFSFQEKGTKALFFDIGTHDEVY
jgi:mRNA-degrading endonuclease YafQ of YafQ-DinJ toxin-antitoxin module